MKSSKKKELADKIEWWWAKLRQQQQNEEQKEVRDTGLLNCYQHLIKLYREQEDYQKVVDCTMQQLRIWQRRQETGKELKEGYWRVVAGYITLGRVEKVPALLHELKKLVKQEKIKANPGVNWNRLKGEEDINIENYIDAIGQVIELETKLVKLTGTHHRTTNNSSHIGDPTRIIKYSHKLCELYNFIGGYGRSLQILLVCWKSLTFSQLEEEKCDDTLITYTEECLLEFNKEKLLKNHYGLLLQCKTVFSKKLSNFSTTRLKYVIIKLSTFMETKFGKLELETFQTEEVSDTDSDSITSQSTQPIRNHNRINSKNSIVLKIEFQFFSIIEVLEVTLPNSIKNTADFAWLRTQLLDLYPDKFPRSEIVQFYCEIQEFSLKELLSSSYLKLPHHTRGNLKLKLKQMSGYKLLDFKEIYSLELTKRQLPKNPKIMEFFDTHGSVISLYSMDLGQSSALMTQVTPLFQVLQPLLTDSHLSILNLSQSFVNDELFSLLIKSDKLGCLQHLDVSNTLITNHGLELLVKHATILTEQDKVPELEYLNFGYTRIEESAIITFLRVLYYFPYLSQLVMAGNHYHFSELYLIKDDPLFSTPVSRTRHLRTSLTLSFDHGHLSYTDLHQITGWLQCAQSLCPVASLTFNCTTFHQERPYPDCMPCLPLILPLILSNLASLHYLDLAHTRFLPPTPATSPLQLSSLSSPHPLQTLHLYLPYTSPHYFDEIFDICPDLIITGLPT